MSSLTFGGNGFAFGFAAQNAYWKRYLEREQLEEDERARVKAEAAAKKAAAEAEVAAKKAAVEAEVAAKKSAVEAEVAAKKAALAAEVAAKIEAAEREHPSKRLNHIIRLMDDIEALKARRTAGEVLDPLQIKKIGRLAALQKERAQLESVIART